MKIAILTFHCSYNYGSALQAYALQTFLERKGHSVKIVDYVLSSDFKQYKLLRFDRYIKNPKYLLSDIFFLNKTIRRKRNFVSFKENFLNCTEKKYFDDDDMSELNAMFDAFICGSDQIWNTACTCRVIPAYFLSFVSDDKLKIAYAPSVAQIHDEISDEEKKQLKKLVNRIDYISVREESTAPYIKQFTDKQVDIVLDPTLLLDKKDYCDLISDELNFENRKYIFYYTLQKNVEMEDYCYRLSEEKKLKILYISKVDIKRFKNSENIYGISPNDFIGYIRNAEYIVTNSFHATVFSIIFEKQLCTFGTKKSFVRMQDFLRELGIEQRIYKDSSFNIDEKIDYSDVKIRKRELTNHSKEYIENALKRDNK
ncbi:MAG: polysaccharide pyruvyl transferase family protein [Oscillospiraceae bacterium]|nr:polysaccharide pyruvyl transferase family protein [Oscillospiraceae bacterium]